VATFCQRLVAGEVPEVVDDKEVPLLHAQAAADQLIGAGYRSRNETVRPAGTTLRVSEVRDRLTLIHEVYARGDIPPLVDNLSVDLFNTYRSFAFPHAFPMHPPENADRRGELFEVVRSQGGPGQTFYSTTRPGAVRGEHYHLRRVERFFVVHGEAEIGLRRLLHDDVVTFRLSGARPGFVDMPTLWVHNIRNVGSDDLVTAFWSNQLHDPHDPDQYPEPVTQGSP
jgi:UDP-2-acetamido-2,6-beta-L-arabino-hexul-4-ose reductase